MTKSVAQSLASFSLLIALASACASAKTTPGETMKPAPLDPPSGQSVTAEDIQRSPSVALEDLLTAKVAGVWVSRTSDGGIAVRIRGATTIYGNSAPLYVLNGQAILPGPNGSLPGIAASEIESIEVLKDAASTAMYGMRGSNGVILIKTKSPDQ
jgi:TonB-dependent SusC/RagA subfamily outer membrane receptor